MDTTDRAIVDVLQDRGRVTARAVAEEVGLPESTVRGRINALVASGRIRSTVLVHPSVMGQRIIAFIRVDVDPQAWRSVSVAPVLTGAPWLALTADHDAILTQLAFPEMSNIRDLVRLVNALPGVQRTSVRVVLGIALGQDAHASLGARTGPWPDPPARPVDEIDRTLIEALRADGRASFTALAHQVGLTVAGTRRRVLRLLDDDLVRFVTLYEDGRPEVNADLHLLLDASRREATVTELARSSVVRYIAETADGYDVSLFLAAKREEDLCTAATQIAAMDGVLSHQFVPLHVVRDRVGWDSLSR